MKCLRSGCCCINMDVIILINPDNGYSESNMTHKKSGEKCPHLRGPGPGEYSCAIHNHEIYKLTPCYEFGQIESRNQNCRLGNHLLENLYNAN